MNVPIINDGGYYESSTVAEVINRQYQTWPAVFFKIKSTPTIEMFIFNLLDAIKEEE